MKTAVVKIKGIAPYSQSRHYTEPARGDRETARDYESRTWRERLHYSADGNVFIPPMAFKNCLSEAAKFLGKQIPGKGKSTYTKHFEAGILVMDPMVLSVKKDTVEGEWIFVPSDGKRGGGSRVDKCFPIIREWGGEVTFYVLDEAVTQSVFAEHLSEAGRFIGIGRFRPRNNGFYGRFEVIDITWS